jgi:hypothetical protein
MLVIKCKKLLFILLHTENFQGETYFYLSYSYSLICPNEKVKPALQTDHNAICWLSMKNSRWQLITASTMLILWLQLLVKGLHKLRQVHDLPNTLCWIHIDELVQIMRACCKTYQNYVISLVHIRCNVWHLWGKAELCQFVIKMVFISLQWDVLRNWWSNCKYSWSVYLKLV